MQRICERILQRSLGFSVLEATEGGNPSLNPRLLVRASSIIDEIRTVGG